MFSKSKPIFILLLVVTLGYNSCKKAKINKVSSDYILSTGERWAEKQANAWYDTIPYPVGANYVPATSINQLEMWQNDTFDAERINFELEIASKNGFNIMRVFLHDLAWKQDPEGFFKNVDKYLEIASKNGIYTMFVIFDGVWNPYPKIGKQPEPAPHVHNSGWVQSPGREILEDSKKQDGLKDYVQAVVSRYRNDKRVLIWDLFNEPDNGNAGNFGGDSEEPDLEGDEKRKRALELLEKTFKWVREINPIQPLTAGVWGKPTWIDNPDDIETLSLQESDVISFHSYKDSESTSKMIKSLQKYNRPIFCTEYMARSAGSTFEGIMPVFYDNRVAAINWGLFSGKSQTIYPWSSWKTKFDKEPELWFHDVFRENGEPFNENEIKLIQEFSSRPNTLYKNVPEVAIPFNKEDIAAGLKSRDKALYIKDGWIRDPYIAKGPDGNYYLTGTTPLPNEPTEKIDPYNLGLGQQSYVGWKVQVWKSKDLISWESLSTPYDLYDGIWDEVKPERFKGDDKNEWLLWAPELHWLGDKWALVHTSPFPVNGANFSISKGMELSGWTNPMGAKIKKRHDPSLFKDDDGTLWMVWGATQIAKIRPDLTDFDSKPIDISPSGKTKSMGHEGCLMMKIKGKYVLFGTGWSTTKMRRGSYNLYYATADKIEGPYSERKFVGRFLGHGTPFKTRDGKWWCTAFYNANVPPISSKNVEDRNLGYTAYTINQRGTTIVPLDVYVDEKNELIIRAIPSEYGTPGPDEFQKF
ncbi:family 43 glycosylhydrolase [Seonamhaeicola sp.]|uniref:family 43 glycosylhydrolase n=1 Tax=Seonamhaeicola sp. TaxID=1912245 RepID=UPI002616868B|nr:family 43 glycosylhydrolase [Seonamhaeicola sp.]